MWALIGHAACSKQPKTSNASPKTDADSKALYVPFISDLSHGF